MSEVLVFLPGILGSELYKDENKVWPGSGWEAVRGLTEERFQQLLDPALVAKDLVRSAVGGFVNIYGDWIRRFESLASRDTGQLMFSEAEGTLVPVPYDWRKSCSQTAIALGKALEKIVSNKGNDVRIHLVAHSYGALVARYYLQSGNFDGLPGFSQVSTFVTFGAPHNGAPIALAGITGLHKTDFLSVSQSTRLANDSRYPSLYELLPQPNNPLIWERSASGRLQPRSLSDRAFALNNLGLKGDNYDAYIAFRGVIDGRQLPSRIRRVVMMGTRQETATHFFWTGSRLQTVESTDGGDGTVSIQGAYLPDVQCQLTGEAHVTLIKSVEARQAFEDIMGATGLLAAGVPDVDISVRDTVISIGTPIHATVFTSSRLTHVAGEIAIEGVPLPADRTAPPPKESDFQPLRGRVPQPFSYDGPEIASALVKLPGIGTPGIYRIAIKAVGRTEPLALSPTFVVNTAS